MYHWTSRKEPCCLPITFLRKSIVPWVENLWNVSWWIGWTSVWTCNRNLNFVSYTSDSEGIKKRIQINGDVNGSITPRIEDRWKGQFDKIEDPNDNYLKNNTITYFPDFHLCFRLFCLNTAGYNEYRCKGWQPRKDGIWCPAEDATDAFEFSTLRVEQFREPNRSPLEHRRSVGQVLNSLRGHATQRSFFFILNSLNTFRTEYTFRRYLFRNNSPQIFRHRTTSNGGVRSNGFCPNQICLPDETVSRVQSIEISYEPERKWTVSFAAFETIVSSISLFCFATFIV